MNQTKPGLDKVIKCLSALSDKSPRNITRVCETTELNRNFVSALLNSCANFSLVIVSQEGRSEGFTLTLKAVSYLQILQADFQPISDCIQEILVDTDKINPKTTSDPVDQFLVTIRASESEVYPPYSKLQTLTEAFALASYGYFDGSPEQRAFGEIASMLRAGASVFSPLKSQRELGRKFFKRARDSVQSIQAAGKMIESQKLFGKSPGLEEVGKTKRGRIVYRVK